MARFSSFLHPSGRLEWPVSPLLTPLREARMGLILPKMGIPRVCKGYISPRVGIPRVYNRRYLLR